MNIDKNMNKKNLIILIPIIILLVGSIISVYLLKEQKSSIKQKENGEISAQRQPCLDENERADFTIKRLGKYPSPEYDRGFIEVVVKDINTNKETAKFIIDEIVNPSHYHPAEIHRCGVYATRSFNYDYTTRKSLAGYSVEIWRYNYKGEGEKIVLLDIDTLGNFKGYEHFFSSDFRVSPDEKFVVLEKSYFGQNDYSLVIKDLNTKQDTFTISAKDITKQHPNLVGVFDMLEWSEDSRYFWGSVSEGAYVNGYFRIDASNWKTDIFEAPDGAMGGMPLNINTSYIPIQPGLIWTGDYQLTQELKEQYREEGKKSLMYLYNLFTKEKIKLAEIDNPAWNFRPKWTSDTELEYELPNGEKKVYKLNE